VTPPHSSYEELEELFWKDLLNDKALPPIYGADVCDSITDKVRRRRKYVPVPLVSQKQNL